ncbi:MAG: hypothetical protein ABIP61_11590, partial [Burkholderiaceae bacterium]
MSLSDDPNAVHPADPGNFPADAARSTGAVEPAPAATPAAPAPTAPATAPGNAASTASANPARKRALTAVAAVVALAGIAYGTYWALVLNHFESTDNAYV